MNSKFLHSLFLAGLMLSSAHGNAATLPDEPKEIPGPYKPSWDSLASQYQCPAWFRDAKFGIWAHWSAQCVPEMGDWYAQNMYHEGSPDYLFHTARYGHPSEFGFKDIYPLWHAENWDPEKMMALYKRAGAKYFMALANHHDNFDSWNSKYQPWNSVAIGPKRDIVGDWEKAARAAGLKFAVSVHGSHTYNWMEACQGTDKKGSKAGVPYDGKLTKADGKGKWWEGLDPQDLYCQNHKPKLPWQSGKPFWTWDVKHGSTVPDAAYCQKFYNRVMDLITTYKPDMVYFDDSILPLYQVDPKVGLDIAANYYNSSVQWNNGTNEAVLTAKDLDDQQRHAIVFDMERGKSDKILPFPWQTDTCIGDWHYRRTLFERHEYKTPEMVVEMLVDIVSKNGNLMLNIPVRGDGSIDNDEVAFLGAMGDWFQVNGEGIYATRPWKVYGEGKIEKKAGNFNEKAFKSYGADEVRFTTKGNTLYAFVFATNLDNTVVIRTLGSNEKGIVGDITSIHLLGSDEKIEFARKPEGLVVTLPAKKPCDHAWCLKIEGLDLKASKPKIFHTGTEGKNVE